MLTPDEATGLPGSRDRLSKLSGLIGTRFRNQRLLKRSELLAALKPPEQELVNWLFTADPSEFGLKLPFYGLEEPASIDEFVTLKRNLRSLKGEPVSDVQYVPKAVHAAFTSMQKTLVAEIDGRLVLSSAYRSPAFQVLVICYNAKRHDYDLTQTLARVGLPGYSEHGLIKTCAIDVQLGHERYVRDDTVDAFARSAEFAWLQKHASDFGFRLSYPPANEFGVPFEPWHWRYSG